MMSRLVRYKGKYLVSDTGEVYKINKYGIKLKKQNKKDNGYLETSINGKGEYIHRIVMSAFVGRSPLHIDHINMDKNDNNLLNLEYVTQQENNKRRDEKIGKFGKNNAKKVKWNGKIYNSAKELSLLFGYKERTVAQSIFQGRKIKGHYAEYIKEIK